jgi:hypothetical protein
MLLETGIEQYIHEVTRLEFQYQIANTHGYPIPQAIFTELRQLLARPHCIPQHLRTSGETQALLTFDDLLTLALLPHNPFLSL